MKAIRSYCSIALLIVSCVAHAQGAANNASRFSESYAACLKKAGPPGFYDQSASARCDEAEVALQKKRINVAYDKIVKAWQADPVAIQRLNDAQKSWLQWRNQTYALLQENGGSNAQTVYVVSAGFLLDSLANQAALLEGIVAANGGG